MSTFKYIFLFFLSLFSLASCAEDNETTCDQELLTNSSMKILVLVDQSIFPDVSYEEVDNQFSLTVDTLKDLTQVDYVYQIEFVRSEDYKDKLNTIAFLDKMTRTYVAQNKGFVPQEVVLLTQDDTTKTDAAGYTTMPVAKSYLHTDQAEYSPHNPQYLEENGWVGYVRHVVDWSFFPQFEIEGKRVFEDAIESRNFLIVHELGHSFTPNGNNDHFNNENCLRFVMKTTMGKLTLEELYYLLYKVYMNICPYSWENVRQAPARCG